MKELVLCRHAKSSWKYHTDDLYRPLNKRGIAEAPMMANQWQGEKPELILCSPAVRSYSTALAYMRERDWPLTLLELNTELFEADLTSLLEVITNISDYQRVWLFGHNPGLNLLTEHLTDTPIDNIVTSARAHLSLDVQHWHEAKKGCAKLLDLVTPSDEDE